MATIAYLETYMSDLTCKQSVLAIKVTHPLHPQTYDMVS